MPHGSAPCDPPPPVTSLARRTFLSSGLAGATALGLAPALRAQAVGVGGGTPTSPRRRDPLLLLLQRTTHGYLPPEHELAQSLGYQGWLEAQLDPDSIDDSALDAQLAGLPVLTMTARELLDNYGPNTPGQGVPVQQLIHARMLRATRSRRQLYERMVEFWTDHFNVPNTDNPMRWLKVVDDREVIREHALGNFRDMLHASARSAAMLSYLDNVSNVAGAPNENYAREVMELHTFGVDGPYNENDVRELARCFTGWAYFPPNFQSYGEFVFRGNVHDAGSKVLLGLTIPAGGGEDDAVTVLDHLASHPTTAAYVAGKLVRWLVGYEPSQNLVDEVAATFLATNGDIKEMVRVALEEDRLVAEEPWAEPKLKRPQHFASSLLRNVDAQLNGGAGLSEALTVLGQRPYAWSAPDGYPDELDVWGSSVLPRWDFAWRVVSNQILGVSVPPQNLLALATGASLGNLASALDLSMTGGLLTREEVQGIQAYLDSVGTFDVQLLREAVALVASAPSYQYY